MVHGTWIEVRGEERWGCGNSRDLVSRPLKTATKTPENSRLLTVSLLNEVHFAVLDELSSSVTGDHLDTCFPNIEQGFP